MNQHRGRSGRSQHGRSNDNISHIADAIRDSRGLMSIRQMAAVSGLKNSSTWNILRKDLRFKPFQQFPKHFHKFCFSFAKIWISACIHFRIFDRSCELFKDLPTVSTLTDYFFHKKKHCFFLHSIFFHTNNVCVKKKLRLCRQSTGAEFLDTCNWIANFELYCKR